MDVEFFSLFLFSSLHYRLCSLDLKVKFSPTMIPLEQIAHVGTGNAIHDPLDVLKAAKCRRL